LTKKLKLKAGGGAALSIPVKSLPVALPDGTYYLIAAATYSAGSSAGVATTSTVTVAAPFISLAASVGAVAPATVVTGKTGSVFVTLTNNGNEIASGPADITLGVSTDGATPVAGTTLVTVAPKVKIAPGKSVRIRAHFKVAAGISGTFFPFATVTLDGQTVTAVGPSEFTAG
jgi:hypothetical protein